MRSSSRAAPLGIGDRKPWRWRIYQLTPTASGWHARSLLHSYPLPDVPQEFDWVNGHDISGLKEYIDVVLQGKETEAFRFLERNQVQNVIPHPPAPCEVYSVPADVFVDYLLLRGSISVPINGILRLYCSESSEKDQQRYATSDFIGALAPLLSDADVDLCSRSWKPVAEAPENLIDTAYYKEIPSTFSNSDRAPKETELRRQRWSTAIGLVTRVEHGVVYYTKRVFDVETGRLVYSATAWYPHGPWHEHERDNAYLIATRLPLEQL